MVNNKNLIFKKKAMSNVAMLGIGAGLLLGGWYMLSDNKPSTPSLSFNDYSSDNSNVATQSTLLVDSVSSYNASLFNVTTSGTEENKRILIEADKDSLADTQTFTLAFKQKLNGPINGDILTPYTIKVPVGSDVEMSDSSDEKYVVIDYSASTINSVKGQTQIDLVGTTSENYVWSSVFNPNSATLSSMIEVDESGEKVEYSLDFGQANPIILKIKN